MSTRVWIYQNLSDLFYRVSRYFQGKALDTHLRQQMERDRDTT